MHVNSQKFQILFFFFFFFFTEKEEKKSLVSTLGVAGVAVVAAPAMAVFGFQMYMCLTLDAGQTFLEIVERLFECAEEDSEEGSYDSLDRLLVIRHMQLAQMAAGAQACKLIHTK
jgi:hypothetical protein